VVSFFHEHIQCAFLEQGVGKKNTHINHICISSCSHEQFEHASSEFLFHQNSCDKWYIGIVSIFHEHIQCGVLDCYVEMKKSHTNHIENAFYSHEQIGCVVEDEHWIQNFVHKLGISETQFLNEDG
jgi:hypothetical protein